MSGRLRARPRRRARGRSPGAATLSAAARADTQLKGGSGLAWDLGRQHCRRRSADRRERASRRTGSRDPVRGAGRRRSPSNAFWWLKLEQPHRHVHRPPQLARWNEASNVGDRPSRSIRTWSRSIPKSDYSGRNAWPRKGCGAGAPGTRRPRGRASRSLSEAERVMLEQHASQPATSCSGNGWPGSRPTAAGTTSSGHRGARARPGPGSCRWPSSAGGRRTASRRAPRAATPAHGLDRGAGHRAHPPGGVRGSDGRRARTGSEALTRWAASRRLQARLSTFQSGSTVTYRSSPSRSTCSTTGAPGSRRASASRRPATFFTSSTLTA